MIDWVVSICTTRVISKKLIGSFFIRKIHTLKKSTKSLICVIVLKCINILILLCKYVLFTNCLMHGTHVYFLPIK